MEKIWKKYGKIWKADCEIEAIFTETLPGARREVIYPDCLPNINLQKAENANPTKSNFSFYRSKL